MTVRKVLALIAEFVTGAFIGGALVFMIFVAMVREDDRGITGSIDPRAVSVLAVKRGALDIDACTFSEESDQWLRRDGNPCRGTGEDPVNMPPRTLADVPDMHTDYPRRGRFVAEDSDEFDCRYDGDQLCGYGNSNGVPAGYYGQDHGIFNR